MSENTKIAKAVFDIIIITVLSKILGFLRDIFLAFYYGITYKTDAYIMSQTIANFMITLVIASLGRTMIPIVSDYISNKEFKETNRFMNVLYTVSTLLAIFICVLGIVFSPQLVSFIAPRLMEKCIY